MKFWLFFCVVGGGLRSVHSDGDDKDDVHTHTGAFNRVRGQETSKDGESTSLSSGFPTLVMLEILGWADSFSFRTHQIELKCEFVQERNVFFLCRAKISKKKVRWATQCTDTKINQRIGLHVKKYKFVHPFFCTEGIGWTHNFQQVQFLRKSNANSPEIQFWANS